MKKENEGFEMIYVPDEQSGKYEGHTDVFYNSPAKQGTVPLGYIITDEKNESERFKVFDWEGNQMMTCREWYMVQEYLEIKATLIETDIDFIPLEKIKHHNRTDNKKPKSRSKYHTTNSLKNKNMEQEKNNQPKHQHRIPTEIQYHEDGRWQVGKDIITVVGGLPNEPKQPIATIKLIGYDDNKKPILVVHDLDGNELTERSSNLYQLKRYCLDNEQRLTKEMLVRKNPEQAKEQPAVQPELKKETPEIKKETPEVKKGKDLKSVRKGAEEKQKENEQNLTR